MTSNDLLGLAVPSTPLAPLLGAAAVPPAVINPPVIAGVSPAAPKFKFVFR